MVKTLKPVAGLKGNFPHLQMFYSFQHFLQRTVPTLWSQTKNKIYGLPLKWLHPPPLQSCSFLLTAAWSLMSFLTQNVLTRIKSSNRITERTIGHLCLPQPASIDTSKKHLRNWELRTLGKLPCSIANSHCICFPLGPTASLSLK